jgi:dTDP-4-amino-4,6-dideoxygalactose transaminase
MDKPIYVTKPSLPSLGDYMHRLEDIWASGVVTNNGSNCAELQEKLSAVLGVEGLDIVSSGTFALLSALRLLGIRGPVITTPFTFAATTHVLEILGLEVIFADIDPSSYNLDIDTVSEADLARADCVLPVHCFGRLCEIDKIDQIAKAFDLKVIYDCAHAFGLKHKDKSCLSFGDASALSFHATKVFNCIEGGGAYFSSESLRQSQKLFKNFGITGELNIEGVGLNGKISELHAAVGILNLERYEAERIQRMRLAALYDQFFASQCDAVVNCYNGPDANYGYYPVLFKCNKQRETAYEVLRSSGIYARRYFYPLMSNVPPYAGRQKASTGDLLIANDVSDKILCLPISASISADDVFKICGRLTGVFCER